MRLLAGSLSFVVLAACSGGAPAGTPADDPAGRLVARAIETGQAPRDAAAWQPRGDAGSPLRH